MSQSKCITNVIANQHLQCFCNAITKLLKWHNFYITYAAIHCIKLPTASIWVTYVFHSFTDILKYLQCSTRIIITTSSSICIHLLNPFISVQGCGEAEAYPRRNIAPGHPGKDTSCLWIEKTNIYLKPLHCSIIVCGNLQVSQKSTHFIYFFFVCLFVSVPFMESPHFIWSTK